ncbi:MAG TPA: nuclear transport factor 2 family protein [Candidatus Angelobacter sp.]
MQHRFFQRLLSVMIAAAVFVSAQEPVKPKLNSRIITATKQVQMFLELEMQFLKAVQKKDQAGVQAMLTEEFQIQMPDADPLAGDDWLEQVMAKDFTLQNFGIREMTVVDLGNAAVVKFERRQDATYKGQPANGEFFVLDVWKKEGDAWKLANRFVSQTSSAAMPKKPVKPTGKQ